MTRRLPGGQHRLASGQAGSMLVPAPATGTHDTGPGRGAAGRDPAGRRPAGAGPADQDGSDWAARALRTLAGVFVVSWAFRLSAYLTVEPWLAVAMVVLGLAGLLAIISAWLPDQVIGRRRQRQIDWAVLAAVLAALALWSFFQVLTAPDYGTDEIAFDQYAAQLAWHGVNPYLHSMAPAFHLFHVSPNGYTFQLDGRPVTSLSYPALSFEAYEPLLAAGLTTQAAVWMDVGAWALGAVILFAVLPRRLAPLAAVLASMDIFVGYAAGGVTDSLFVPLLVGAAVGWDQFAYRRGPAAWRGPVLLGLAMAVKQTPWLIAPFLVTGIIMESWPCGGRQALRTGLRYAAIALAAFLAPNLPYLLTAPGAWLRGVLTPFSAQTVPAGQGLISLSLSLMTGGGSLRAYTIAAVVVMAAAVACYAATYPVLKAAAFLLPSVVLFFGTRSFGSYLVMLIPAAVAAAATTAGRQPGVPCWRRWRWVVLGGAAACAAAVTAALTAASPLAISVRSVQTTGQLATLDQLNLTITNNTGGRVRPAFTIQDGTTMTAFWRRQSGPAVLAPHQRARYTIVAPSYFAMPSISNGFQVLAFSQGPSAVSRSSAYAASQDRVMLWPATVGQPVAPGRDITVRAEIVNRLDQPVRGAGVPVYLGQVIYAQRGLEFSQAIIDHGQPGQTPVGARTNSRGVATFTISSPVGGSDPVYFEANLVMPGLSYPYGYSPILAVRFRR